MTFRGCQPLNFGQFFGLFEKYLHLCQQRKILCSSFDVFIRTEAIFIVLEKDWNKNKWDNRKLR